MATAPRTTPRDLPAGANLRIPKSQLGFAALLLGGAWLTLAVLLVSQTLGSRAARSPLTFLALACGVGAIGCAMLVLAFFPRLVQILRPLGWISVAAGAMLAASVVWSEVQLPPDQLQLFANPGDARDASNLAVAASLIALTCSASLITTRLLSNQASRHHFQPIGAVQALFAMFWRQHQLVGWMALALAGAHSVYYLLYPRTFEEQWTGIVSIGLMALLGVVGLATSYRTRARLWIHRGMALVLAVVLTLHWPPILYAEIGALLVLGITAFLNLKLATAVARAVLGD